MHKHGGDIYTHKNVIDFSANINFRGMPEAVQQAAREAVELCGNYPDTECRALREAISQREQVAAEQVICGNGAAELIFSLVMAKKPRKALLLAPTFYEYEQALRTVDCQLQTYQLREEYGFGIQEDFLDCIEEGTHMVFLCNPNNPTGVLTEPDFLLRVLRRCEACGALLVVDECFNDFLEEPEYYSMKQQLCGSRQLFILKAFTKMYAMAGLRLGYGLCSDRELLETLGKMRQPWSVSIPAQAAGIAAAQEVGFAEESKEQIKEEGKFLKEKFAEMGYPIIGSAANYIFFKGPEDLHESCLHRGILIRDCSNYEGLGSGWYRIAVKSRQENRKLLSVLEKEALKWQKQS